MLDVGFSELKNSFKKHSRCAKDATEPSFFLLLFYAVECGLKARIIQSLSLHRISQIRNRCKTDHNIHNLALFLRLPASITQVNANFRLQRDNSSRPIEQAHEAWRYGAVINKEDQKKIVKWLTEIQEKLEEVI